MGAYDCSGADAAMTNVICRVFGHRIFTFSLRGYEEGVCVRCWREGGLRITVTSEPDRYVVAGTDGRVYDSVTNTWTDSKPKTQGNDTVKVSGSQG